MIRRFFRRLLLTALSVGLLAALYFGEQYGIIPEFAKKAEDFGIETVIAPTDRNGNGADDYTDLMHGARIDALLHPEYIDAYYIGGYPPWYEGVCTDLVWRAFRYAGYDLKAMVDADIASRPWAYPDMDTPDPNIDFRRVKNLSVFFRSYARALTTDIHDIAAWQPGDIVIFGNDAHIGIISDYRDKDGLAFVIHNGGANTDREESALTHDTVTGHYRFDASLIDPNILK